MSSASNKGQQGSSASSDEILVSSHETTRVLTLNRPKVFNALNLPMVRTMVPLLKTWRDNDLVDKVILKGTGSKAFCAGGDVKAIAEAGKAGLPLTKEFFREEYQLNHLIGTFNKPIIAIINGITMGGGVGLSVHAPIRIATENTLFSMPETAIGLFPDVGGSFFLPRLDGELGMFLGLTGHRLKGKDLLYAGIATHYIQSSRLEFVENQLLKASGMDVISIADLLEDFSDDSQTPFSLQQHREVIDRCFSKGSVEEIIEALKAENSPWANEIVTALSKVSPTSLKLTFRQIRNGKVLDFLECFKMEFRLTQRVMKGKDFYEGIRAVLIDKDQKPMWNPSTLSNVLDLTIQKHFEALDLSNDGTADFQPFRGDSYLDYPHRKTALLSENEIIKIASRQPLTTFEQLYEKLRKESGYTKRGLKEKLQDVVQRRCQVLPGGIVSPKL